MLRRLFHRPLPSFRQLSVLAAVFLLLPFLTLPSHAVKPEDLDWIRLQADGTVVYSSADEEKSLAIVEGLLRFRADCLAFLPVDDFIPPAPTIIYLLNSESAYDNLCKYSSSAVGTAGVFYPAIDANYIAIDLTAGSAGLTTVYHEYFHFIAQHTMPTLPLWANEGLAEFFSTYEFKNDHGIIGHPIKDHMKVLQSEDPMPFVDLFAVNYMSDDYHGGYRNALFYAQSWAVVHSQLTGTPAEREGFLGYLAAIAEGMSAQEAMVESLDLDEVRIIDQIAHRTRNLELPVLTPEQRRYETVAWQTGDPGNAEILNALGMFTVRLPRTHPEAPRKYFQDAQLLDPEGFMPHLGLALVERNEHSDQSRANFARARESAPNEPLVLDAYGEFLVDQYEQASDRDADAPTADLELARELFLASLGTNPEGPRALAGYAMSYQYEGEIPDKAIDALDRAITRYPSRINLLMAKCIFTARRGKHEEAWSLYRGELRSMRPGRDVIQSVSETLLHAALVDAYNTAQSGKIEEGRLILEVALKRYGSDRSRKEAWEQFAEAESYGRHNLLVDRYNEGIDALNAQDFPRALELMEEVASAAVDSTLREQAVETCEYLRTRIK
jgi:Tfp pilus assembly protein PilF